MMFVLIESMRILVVICHMVNKRILLKLFASACLITFCFMLDNIDVYWSAIKGEIFVDVQYFWLNSVIYGGIFGGYFICILASYPYAGVFIDEYKQGIWKYVIKRYGIRRYVWSNVSKSFVCGSLSALIGGVFFVGGTSIKCSLFDSNRLVEVTGWLPFSHFLEVKPILYFIFSLFLLAVHGGILSMLTYMCSCYYPVKQFIYISPFIISFVVGRVNAITNIDSQFRIDYILCGRSGAENNIIYIFSVIIIWFLLYCICYILSYIKIRRRLENE